MKQRINAFFRKHPAFNFAGIVTLFIAIEGLYSFCTAEKQPPVEETKLCPRFSDLNLDAWFPYTADRTTVYFTASSGAVDTITLGRLNKDPESVTPITHPCVASAILSSQETNANGTYRFSVIQTNTEGQQQNRFSMSLYDFYLPDAWLQEADIAPTSSSIKSQFYTSLDLSGKSFTRVVELMRDTTVKKDTGVYKVWIAKQKGLVGFEYYPTLEQFVKQ